MCVFMLRRTVRDAPLTELEADERFPLQRRHHSRLLRKGFIYAQHAAFTVFMENLLRMNASGTHPNKAIYTGCVGSTRVRLYDEAQA